MSVIKMSVCQRLQTNADNILLNLEMTKYEVQNGIYQVKNTLSGYTFDPDFAIDNICELVLNSIQSIIPDLSEFDEILELINSCEYLSEDSILGSPNSVLKGISSNMKTSVFGNVTDIVGNLPEFDAAKAFDSLSDQIKSNKLDTNIPSLGKALQCMNNVCGVDISSRLTRLETFASDCYLSLENGQIDIVKILESQGLDPKVSLNIVKASDTLSLVSECLDFRVKEAKSYLTTVNV